MDPRVVAARTERWLPVVAVAAVLAGPALALAVPGAGPAPVGVLAVGVAAQLAATAVLSTARQHPLAAFLTVIAVAAALSCVPGTWRHLVQLGAVPWVPLAVAWAGVRAFTIVDDGAPRRLRPAAAASVVYLVALAVWGPGPASSAVLGAAAPLLGGLSVSLAWRLRRARARRAEAERARQDADALRTRAEERQRIADALHDDLGHVLTLVVLQAATLAARPDADVPTAAHTLGELGRRGLTSLRGALQLVTDPATASDAADPSRPLLPTGLYDLAEQARAAGQNVAVSAPTTIADVDRTGQAALLRVAREGLTNARRHAPGTSVRIDLDVGPDGRLVLTVDNEAAPPAATADDIVGSGRGLAAVGRGIDLLGGTFRHGPTGDGGYALRVELPPAAVR